MYKVLFVSHTRHTFIVTYAVIYELYIVKISVYIGPNSLVPGWSMSTRGFHTPGSLACWRTVHYTKILGYISDIGDFSSHLIVLKFVNYVQSPNLLGRYMSCDECVVIMPTLRQILNFQTDTIKYNNVIKNLYFSCVCSV